MPWNQTVNGAVDAISHIMEYYFMTSKAETTLALDESLICSIIKTTDILKDNPNDYNARANFAWAATLALNGISGAGLSGGDWATHGIEHGISAYYPEIAHGQGLAIVFPAWIEYCKDEDPEIFLRWARKVWNKNSIQEGILALKEKYSSWGAPITLKEAGVSNDDFEKIAEHTVVYGMTGSKKMLGKQDILKILEKSL